MVYASSDPHLDMLEDAIKLANDDVQPDAPVTASPSRALVVVEPTKPVRKVSLVKAKRLARLHETVAVGFALSGLIAGYIAWRLSEGTISIQAAAPLVESALEKIVGGQTKIGALRLGWDKDRRDFVVTANKITATTDARTSPLALGQVDLTLNAQALLSGRAQITRADLTGLQAVLVLDKDGRTAFGFGTLEEVLKLPRMKGQSRSLRELLDSVRKAVLPDGDKGRVEAVALRNAQLTIIDPDTGERLTLRDARANVTTDANKIVTMQAAGFAQEMGGFGNVAVSASPDARQRLVLAAKFDRARLSQLPSSLRVGPLAQLSGATAPISGNVLVHLGENRTAFDATADLNVGAGRVQGFDLKGASGALVWNGAAGRLNLTNISLDAVMATLREANASISNLGGGLRNLIFDARSIEASLPTLGSVSGDRVKGSVQLRADNLPQAGSITGRSLAILRNGFAQVVATDFDAVLTRPNARQPDRVALRVKSNGVAGTVGGRNLTISGLTANIDGVATSSQFTPDQISASGTRFAHSLPINARVQDFDIANFQASASQFSRQQPNTPGNLSLTASQISFGSNPSAFAAGRATAVSLTATDLQGSAARTQATFGDLTASIRGTRPVELQGRSIAFDGTARGQTNALIHRLSADTLNVSVAGASIGTVGFIAIGNLGSNGFTAASIASNSVEIRQAEQLVRPFWADNLRVAGSFGTRSAALDGFSFRHRGVNLSGAGSLALAPKGSPRVDLVADVDGEFSVETLLSAWPRRFLPETRGNIARLIPSGTASVSQLALAIPSGMLPKQILPPSAMDLEFDLKDVTVTYLRGMSAITNVSGHGILKGRSLLLTLPTGSINNIALSDGRVEIAEFMPRGAILDINANVRGDVTEMANEVDMPALAILSKANFDPARLTGNGTAQIGLKIPLKPALLPNDIEIKATGDFQNASLARTFAGLDAVDGTAHLQVQNNNVSVAGQAKLAGNLFDFVWKSTVEIGARPQVELAANGNVAVASLAQFGVNLDQFAAGNVRVDIKSNSQGADFGAALINADLTDTNITLPGDIWKKERGVAGTGSASLYPREGGGWNVQNLQFDSAGAMLRGTLDLSDNADLVDARLSRVILPNAADLSVNVTPSGNGLIVALRGDYLNLSPYLKTKNVSEQAVELFDRPLTLSADIKRVTTSEISTLTNVHADILRDLQGWRALSASGDSPTGPSQIKLKVERDGRRSVSGVLSDAGLFAQLLYPGAPVFGGTGIIEGELPVVGANSSGILTFTGKDISFARQGASPILFDNVALPMSVRGGVVTLRDGQADGDAYTVKASGYVDVGAGRLDLRGVATPGGLNRVLSDIPLFGAILGGGEDEGLLGITFVAKGAMTSPRMIINPISALAPGFLRKLFERDTPLSPQPRLVVTTLAGDPIATKWPYGPTEDMSEALEPAQDKAKAGPAQ